MSFRDAIESVEIKLRELQALQGMKVLEQGDSDLLIEQERSAEEYSKQRGFLKVVNDGFWATFRREQQIALVLKVGMEIKPRVNELLQLRNGDGSKIGEWVSKDKAPQRAGVSNFMLGDFVLYEGAKLKGQPYLVVPEIPFPFLEGVKGIQSVTSCSPASGVDDLIRGWMALKEEGLFTRIVGFDIDRDDIG